MGSEPMIILPNYNADAIQINSAKPPNIPIVEFSQDL